MKHTLLAGVGAALGALARYGLGLLFPAGPGLLLAINAAGCLAIARLKPSPFVTTGMLGGFTSYSAFQASFSFEYAAITFATCLGCYFLGRRIPGAPA
ncbi:CrcB family protein [Staphylococcus chromogenes]|nr:CrcB family protein [Staphylococcus chromogenes]